MTPRTMKMSCQRGTAMLSGLIFSMPVPNGTRSFCGVYISRRLDRILPAAIKLPIIPPHPTELYQIVWRKGDSARVYQKPVINDKPGVTAASVAPRKKRLTMAAAKFLQAIMVMTQAPHRTQVTPRTRPAG